MTELVTSHTLQLGREVYLRPGTSDEGTWKEAFECGYHVPPPEMPTPRTVLDLGANIGLTAAHYAAMWPDAIVWMVEPNPDNMELARRNAPRCPPLSCAVARESGRYWLREEGLSADAYTLAEIGEEHEGCRDVYAMSMVMLAEIAKPDFVKMDVEGSEWEIFDPGWGGPQVGPDDIPYLLVEWHAEPRDYPKLLARGIEMLENIGYKARHHPPHPAAVWAVAP